MSKINLYKPIRKVLFLNNIWSKKKEYFTHGLHNKYTFTFELFPFIRKCKENVSIKSSFIDRKHLKWQISQIAQRKLMTGICFSRPRNPRKFIMRFTEKGKIEFGFKLYTSFLLSSFVRKDIVSKKVFQLLLTSCEGF